MHMTRTFASGASPLRQVLREDARGATILSQDLPVVNDAAAARPWP
jgi:hypothetical protein